MNANNPSSNLIFRDQPLPKTDAVSTAYPSLRAACQEPSDRLDALLRASLVLCMLIALLICGWHVNAWQKAGANVAQPTVAAGAFCVDGKHAF